MVVLKNMDIKQFHKNLIQWYKKNYRKLPWRNTTDPYLILISEVMLQQTQVNTVIPYFKNFLKIFPTIQDLAKANQQKVLKIWEGLGYYARARNLHKAAKIIVREYYGKIPESWVEFRQLPGVGDYIASAVISLAFGKPYAVVDGNVKRVLSRLFLIENPVNQSASQKAFQKQANYILDEKNPGIFNQAIMELGAVICTPKNPSCNICTVQKMCEAYRLSIVIEYPKRIKRKPVPEYRIATGVIYKNGKILITKRKPEGLLGGLWEFPGGKIEDSESAKTACIREIKEETGLVIEIDHKLTQIKHAYTHFKIKMDVFICRYVSGKIILNEADDFRWTCVSELNKFPFPKANHKFIPLLNLSKAE